MTLKNVVYLGSERISRYNGTDLFNTYKTGLSGENQDE
jgi:hypothetical protein